MVAARRPPEGLGDRGRRLWRRVVREYDLAALEVAPLEEACRQADVIARIEAELAVSPSLVVPGSKGQAAAHPLVAELRQHRLVLDRLLGRLGADAADSGEWDGLTASTRSRKAALRRWRPGAA